MTERIIIRHPNGETLPLYGRGNVVEISSGQQKKKLLGENIVEMTVRSARPITFYIGDKITVFGEDYFLNLLPEAKKEGGKYEYSLTFESVQYDLAKVVFLDEDKSGLSTSTNFTLRANIEEIAEFNLKDLGDGRIVWDPRKEKPLEIELTSQQVELLQKAGNALDEAGKVTTDNLPVLEKIDALSA